MALMVTGCCYYDHEAFNKRFGDKREGLRALHLNMRSIKNKKDDLGMCLNSFTTEFDAVVLTETWLTDADLTPHLKGYRSVTLNRLNRRGGGVMIYLKSNLQYRVIDDVTKTNENVESLFIITFNVVVGALYRPPSGNVCEFIAFLESAFYCLHPMNVLFMILGDVNIDVMSESRSAREFRDIINAHACNNVINIPTRITPNTATCLDICITNIDVENVSAGVLLNDISDHLPIFCLGYLKIKNNSSKNGISFGSEV